ncbi:MAG TPA: Smr/MutS family protein [Syntrophomonadaceae bacterium]|nr:Smr/MutS family protein [Syntrophomonadaceae bacterium]
MKIEALNLHGLSLDEALEKTKINIKWCIKHHVEVLDINHGKGFHSERGFSVIKQEVRRLLKEDPFIKDSGYIVVPGESNLPIALTFDEGHTLIVYKGCEKKNIGGKKQFEKDYEIFSEEGKRQRKMKKRTYSRKKPR